MEEHKLLEAHVQVKRMYNLLNEVMDLSRQLAEAVDRDDRVSIHMLVDMRQEPINKLEEANQILRRQVATLSDSQDAQRLRELLGGNPAQSPEEAPLAEQIASNSRLLKQVVELDKILSRKLIRDKSIYEQTK